MDLGTIFLSIVMLVILYCVLKMGLVYCVKMAVYLILIFFGLFGPFPIMPFLPKQTNKLITCYTCRLVGYLYGVNFEIRGLENMKKEKGGVVLANHQSFIDVMALSQFIPHLGKSTVTNKMEVAYFLPIGLAAYLCGNKFINRKNQATAMVALNELTKEMAEENMKVVVFPEGTRHQGDNLLPFKKGAFHMAIDSQMGLFPIVMNRYTNIDGKKKIFGKGHYIMSFLPEIPAKGLAKSDLDDLLKRTYDIMNTEYIKLNEEIKARNAKF